MRKWSTRQNESEKELVRGTSSIVTSEVKLDTLSIEANISEFYKWCEKALFYADIYIVAEKAKNIQRQTLLQYLDTTPSTMLEEKLTENSDF